MTYSRQQWDRAVGLYIRYECCAADAIHELGYPSKEALRMWYRERLEEERAGVPSRRGERQRRYSEEQKRAAVDHYLECGRRLSRTMRMLGYPESKELLMAWIDELAPGRRRLRHGPVPEELKRKAVVAVASGRLKSHEAAAELGVQAAVVREWKRQMLAGSKETHVARERREDPGAEAAHGPWFRMRRRWPPVRGMRPVWRTRWRRWRSGWRGCRPVWTSWTPTSSGSGGRRGSSTSRSRSAGARWSCWGKSRAQTRKT